MMRSSVPAFSSTISSAIRRSARSTARASRTVDCLAGMTAEYAQGRRLMKARRDVGRSAAEGLEHMALRYPRLVWPPRPFAMSDEELGPPVHRDGKGDLRDQWNDQPERADTQAATSHVEPSADDEQSFDEQIAHRPAI